MKDDKRVNILIGLDQNLSPVESEICSWWSMVETIAARNRLIDRGATSIIIIPEGHIRSHGYKVVSIKEPFWKRLSRLIFGRLVWLNEVKDA